MRLVTACLSFSLTDIEENTNRLAVVVVATDDQASAWIENQTAGIVGSRTLEVEHLIDRIGDSVERPLSDALAVQPVVLNEMDDGGLVGHGVVYEVLLCPG